MAYHLVVNCYMKDAYSSFTFTDKVTQRIVITIIAWCAITLSGYAQSSFSVISTTVCMGQPATLLSSGCTGSVFWKGSGVLAGSGATPTLTVNTLQMASVESYTATCKPISGADLLAVGTITTVAAPALSLAAPAGATITEGNSATLLAGCTGGTLTWSTGAADNGKTSIVVSPTLTTAYSATCSAGGQCQVSAGQVINVIPAAKLNLVSYVNKSKAYPGELLTYTVVLTNTGKGSASNIIVNDLLSTKATYIPNSVSYTAGSFTTGIPMYTWAIASLPASGSATLVFSASVVTEGVVFNSATITNVDTAQVCTSIPFRVCAGSNYAIRIDAPAGYSKYKFYNGTTLLAETTVNSYTATAAGEYKVIGDNLPAACSEGSCCPIIIEEWPLPSLTLTASAGLTIATGTTLTLTASGCTSGTIAWPSNLTGTNALTRVVSPMLTTTYSVSCITPTACVTSVSTTINVINPQVTVLKKVDKGKAQLGEVLSYTLTVINPTPVTATNIVVRDSLSGGGTIIPGSIAASTGQYTQGPLVNLWSIPSLPANTTVTVVYSVSVTAEGIIYGKASNQGVDMTVCTSVPFRFCKGDPIDMELVAPAGYARYEWYNGTAKVYDGPLNSYTALSFGQYKVIAFNGNGQCQDMNCCPVIIEEDSIPAFTVVARSPSCIANQPQSNGRLTITGLGVDPSKYRYQLSEGTSFNLATATTADPIIVPTDGIIATTLNQSKTYTVRVFNTTGCYRDFTVVLQVNCACKPDDCVPISVKTIRRRL